MIATNVLMEMLVAVSLISATAFVIIITKRERKLCRDTMQMMGDALLGYERQLHNAMLLIKSNSVEEVAKVETEKKNFDLKVKYLEDALAQAKEDTKKKEPQFVQTSDGRKFDVRDLEVF